MNVFIESTLRLMGRARSLTPSIDDEAEDAAADEVLSLGAEHGREAGTSRAPAMDAGEVAEVEHDVRAHVVARMATRGVVVEPESILLAANRAAALRLVVDALGGPADCPVAVENPTAPAVLAALGKRCFGVKRGTSGLDLIGLDQAFAAGARVFYTTATGHEPTGATLTAAERSVVLALARRYDAWVVDDDGNSDITWSAAPPPLLRLAGAADRVVHLGGHASLLAPLPTGAWVVLPACARDTAADVQTPAQREDAARAWDRFFRRFGVGGFELRLGAALESLRERRDALLTALHVYVGDAAEWAVPQAGASLLLRPTRVVSSGRLAELARRKGLLVEPAAPCFLGGDDGGALRLSFANLDSSRMGTAAWRLAMALAAATEP